MRQLHLVGFTSDQDGIILAGRRGSKTGGYVVTMDEEFLEQVDNARRMRAGFLHGSPMTDPNKTRVESMLSPREMQTRLRGGRTVAQVATEAGVSIEWVERFAAPVLAEQAAAVVRAQSATMRTQRRGHSDRPLGPSVLRNLADRGVRLAEDEFDELWSAFQLAENEWVIRFKHRWHGRELNAEWVLDDGAGSLTPSNRQATELGFVDPGRHAPPVKGLAPIRVLRRADPVAPPAAPEMPGEAEPNAVAAKPSGPRSASKASKTTTKAAARKAGAAKARRPLKATRGFAAGRAVRPAKANKKQSGSAVAKTTKRKTPAKTAKAAKTVKAGKTVKATKPARAVKTVKAGKAAKSAKRPGGAKATKSTRTPAKAVSRQRTLKAVRAGVNGTAHVGTRAVRAGAASRNGSAVKRVASVSRAGGNGSRRSRG